MKINNGSLDDTAPLSYNFITETANICESAQDALQFMQRRGYREEVIHKFKEYCSNFTEINSSPWISDEEESTTLAENVESKVTQNLLYNGNPEKCNTVFEGSFDEILSDSDDEFL